MAKSVGRPSLAGSSLARGLGSTTWVSSPTFALVHQYQGKIPLCHFDLFRITSLEDLYSTGFSSRAQEAAAAEASKTRYLIGIVHLLSR